MDKSIKLEPDFSIPLNVVYEDEDVVVINKQAGVSVHPSINEPSGTLVNALVAKYPEISAMGGPASGWKSIGDPSNPSGQETNLRPGIVHRLDKDTSGLLVIAKNQKSFEFLKKEWQNGNVVKKYLALVWGLPKPESGKIESELARSPKDFRKRVVVRPGKKALAGKLAVTEYEVINKFRDFSLVEVYPKTGRMHQIRVHMASLGYPVVGDKLYGKRSPFGRSPVGRQFLHAYYLRFSLPNGKSLALQTDLPEDLKRVLTKLEK